MNVQFFRRRESGRKGLDRVRPRTELFAAAFDADAAFFYGIDVPGGGKPGMDAETRTNSERGGNRLSGNIFVVGGCRSGKSRHALELAEKISGDRRVFIATCVPCDDEMKERVRKHRQERGDGWTAVEAPVELAGAIVEQSANAGVILADCLTLWMANLLAGSEDPDARVAELADALAETRCPVIVVSNEVGTGIVPENALARRYRDAVGFANQRIAAVADEVIWTVAGIPVKIIG
jgi:adenosylcobinamide kinase/adenosylcobinamide-phosphate guanylyltransferase